MSENDEIDELIRENSEHPFLLDAEDYRTAHADFERSVKEIACECVTDAQGEINSAECPVHTDPDGNQKG